MSRALPSRTVLAALGVVAALGCTRSNPAFWGIPDSGIVEAKIAPDAAGTAKVSLDAGPDTAPADIGPDLVAAVGDAAPDASPIQGWAGRTRIALMGATPTTRFGGRGGDAHENDLCPMDEVLIGYRGSVDIRPISEGIIGHLEALCGRLEASNSGSRMTVSPGATLASLGRGSGFAWTARCPADEVIVGFGGYANGSLDAVRFQCAPLFLVAGQMPDVSIGTVRPLPLNGRIGRNPFQESCEPGQVARGQNVRAGDWIDAFGLICGTPTLAP